ncbi:MAG: 6-phosphofructokinase [Chlamydiae bacterium]|nr:MAG: 6-phosphofructokinase [Chlamydiota bacterium]
MKVETIAVLTSGGDAPGMNTCVRAVVRSACAYKMKVIAVKNGLQGLIDGDFKEFGARDVAGIVHKGGTILGTARSKEFRTKRGRKKAAKNIQNAGIDALVIIGGDGSFRGGYELNKDFGIPFVGLPGTIDNDMYGTDFTIGFDTAVNTAVDAIDKIRDTAESHHRLFFVEVMGRHSGAIAVEAAIAGGAELALIPEVTTDIDALANSIVAQKKAGKKSAIIIVAEGDDAGSATEISDKVYKLIGFKGKVCVLGHIQRGGHPSARDRVLASRLGIAAVKTLKSGKSNVLVGEIKGDTALTPVTTVVRKKKKADMKKERFVRLLGT